MTGLESLLAEANELERVRRLELLADLFTEVSEKVIDATRAAIEALTSENIIQPWVRGEAARVSPLKLTAPGSWLARQPQRNGRDLVIAVARSLPPHPVRHARAASRSRVRRRVGLIMAWGL
ncbi:hypothetical protein ACWEQP_35225 [Streptomyces sp. NPDC004044]